MANLVISDGTPRSVFLTGIEEQAVTSRRKSYCRIQIGQTDCPSWGDIASRTLSYRDVPEGRNPRAIYIEVIGWHRLAMEITVIEARDDYSYFIRGKINGNLINQRNTLNDSDRFHRFSGHWNPRELCMKLKVFDSPSEHGDGENFVERFCS